MKVLILGTSNSILKGGVADVLQDHFGAENITNLSIGGASGTFLALFRFIEGVDFTDYDIVFFDFIVNEQSTIQTESSISHLRNIAKVFYSCLPAGVIYVYLGFCTGPNFRTADAVEEIHRQLSAQAGVHFVALRDLFKDFGLRNKIRYNGFFRDGMHYKPTVVAYLLKIMCQELAGLEPKTVQASLGRGAFFIQDVKPLARSTETHKTSLRSQTYGVFCKGSAIPLEAGCFLGFDFVTLHTDAFLKISAFERNFSKALYFGADRPWMKVAGFFGETNVEQGSRVVLTDEAEDGFPEEHTEATVRPAALTGDARLGNFFFSHKPINELAKLYVERPTTYSNQLHKMHVRIRRDMADNAEAVIDLIQMPATEKRDF